MSKLNRFQKIIVGIILLFVIGGFLLKSITGYSTNNLGYDGISMLKYALIDHPTQTLKNWVNDLSNLWAVNEENDQLRYEMSKQPSYKAELDELKRKNKELEATLKLTDSDKRYKRTSANVIARDQAYWNNQLTIDKGKNDGIVVDMAVVSANGVVGKIKSVSQYTSIVKLLTSQDKLNTASIKVSISDKKSIEGILQSYDAKKGMYVMSLFEDSDDVKKGMQVVTSGKGGVYPSGLFVGTVESVQSLTNQIGKTIYVKPIEEFQAFDIVMVIGSAGETK